MLTEEGHVISVQGPQALVRTHRGEACHACGARGACSAMGGGKEMRVMVLNHLRAKPGDRVELSLPESAFLKASIVTYLIPLIAVMTGAVLGQVFAGRLGWSANGASIALAAAGLVLSGLFVLIFNKRLAAREDFIPRITRILPELSALGGKSDAETC